MGRCKPAACVLKTDLGGLRFVCTLYSTFKYTFNDLNQETSDKNHISVSYGKPLDHPCRYNTWTRLRSGAHSPVN